MMPRLTVRESGQFVPMDTVDPRDSGGRDATNTNGRVTGGKTTPESFTLSSRKDRKRGESPPPCFRIETTDSGFRVRLDYYDEAGQRHRPYCCYLSAQEWDRLKGMTFEEAVPRIAERIAARRPKNEAEQQKIRMVSRAIRALSIEGQGSA